VYDSQGFKSISTTGRLVFQLQAEGNDEGEDACEARLPSATQLEVSGWWRRAQHLLLMTVASRWCTMQSLVAWG